MDLIQIRKDYLKEHEGRSELHLICGNMFGGKTSVLISIIETAGRVDKVLYINSAKDTRNDLQISTHSISRNIEQLISSMNGDAIKVNKLSDIPLENLINADGTLKYSTLVLDEIQFFPDLKEKIILFVDILKFPYVYAAGLDGDANRENFGQVHQLIPLADTYMKLKITRCQECAKSKKHEYALFTHCFKKNGEQVNIGGQESYSSVCRNCYLKLNPKHN